MRRTCLLLAAWALVSAAPAHAQSWVDQLFPERSFDFGNVARGSKVRHAFRLVNRTGQDVHIADWRTKCGCTEVRVGARDIPPGTQTTVEAVIDTTKFLGVKRSGLTLILDRPGYMEVDLDVVCFIRGDIVLTPGYAEFGVVPRGAGQKPTVAMNLSYAGGQPNWGVQKIVTRSPHVKARLEETSRSGSGQAQYTLNVTLDPSQVNGFFKDEITLYTNDPTGPTIPVAVTATVQAAVTVSPSPLLLGQVKAGQTVTKTLLVRAAQPFKVTAVKPGKGELTAAPAPADAKPLHTLNLTFKAPAQPGPYNAVCEVETDVKDEPPAKITLFATVVP